MNKNIIHISLLNNHLRFAFDSAFPVFSAVRGPNLGSFLQITFRCTHPAILNIFLIETTYSHELTLIKTKNPAIFSFYIVILLSDI